MSAPSIFAILPTIFRELVHGSPDPAARTYLLNQGDHGLLAALEQLSADQASRSTEGGASIAAHVEHLRYGLAILNGWASGTPRPTKEVDFTASWRKTAVSGAEWRALRDALRREAEAWLDALRTPRELSEVEAGWLVGSVAHLAYHLGAIRQIDRVTRGPTAEEEARAQAQHGARD
jgi:hypothetical protein